MDKRKDHDAVDEPSSEKQFCKLDAIAFIVWKIWSHSTSTTWSYGMQSGSQASWLANKIVVETFKIIYRMKYSTFHYV